MLKNPTNALGQKPVGRLLFGLSLPAAFGMLIMALYNIVDTIFVGRGIGINAIGGVSIVFPIQMILMGVALGIGIGGASVISRALGAKDPLKAEKTLGNMVFMLIIMSFIVVIPGYIFLRDLLRLFGATDTLLKYASDYMKIILPGFPLMMFVMMLNNVIRAEGRAKVAMFTMLLGAILNTVFDPVFIFIFKMGIQGAAWATVLANLITFSFLWFYLLTSRNTVKFSFSHLKYYPEITKEITALGMATLIRNGSRSLITVIVNKTLYYYGTDLDIAVYGLMHRILAILFMPMFGILQGMQPIVGYNYGAGNFKRVRQTIKISVISSTLIALTGFIFIMLFAADLLSIFSNSEKLLTHGAPILKITSLGLPLLGVQFVGAALFQSLGKAGASLFQALLRQFVLFLPMAIILPVFWGTDGLWTAFPIADFLAFLLTVYLLKREFGNSEIMGKLL